MPTLNPNNYAYLWSPTRQILDKNGKPLVGGYVMLNQHGTTGIEALSYSDWNGTLNARRILLDSLGRASAIVENDRLYDMYVYNKFNVLEYSALGVNCTGEGGGESPMRFTSNDGSIDIYRSGNNVDFSVHKDSSTNGTATGDSVNENGLIEFDNVTGDITVISAGSLSVASGKMYHVTLQLEVSMSSYSDQYIDCLMIDSENTSHKFVLDGSRAKQLVDLSWDLSATHSYVRFYVSVPSNASVDDAVLYIHSVNAITVGSGGGGVTEVAHDETLTGNGTESNPLGVAESITQEIEDKLSSVSVDGTTITGDGTPSNPLVAAAQPQEQADWAQTSTTAVDYIKNKPQNLVQDASYVHTDNNFTNADKSKLDGIEAGAEANVQADWTQTSSSADDYIKNKPQNLVQDASYVHTDNNFTNADKSKLDGIESGAEVNDVNDVRVNGTSVVSNKIANVTVPTKTSDLTNDSGFITSSEIPAQVQSDWTETDSSDPSYIKNKPNLATVATSGSYNDLSDKPTIPAIPVQDVEVNGTSVVNASGVAEVTVPTKTSDLNNDSGFITASQVPAQEQSDWNQSNSSSVDYIKNKPQNLVQDASYVHTDNNFTTTLKDKLDGIEAGAEVNVQSDWNQSDNTADDYIKNKPQNLVQDANYVHTDNNFTTTLKDKLDGIAAGAEVNVQSDWNQSDSNADDYIKNKPTINNVPVVTSTDDGKILKASYSGGVGSYEWANESGGTVIDVTVNGSSVVNAQGVAEVVVPVQQQSNWTQSDSSAVDYIKNKPNVYGLTAGSNVAITTVSNSVRIDCTGNFVPNVTSSDNGKVLVASYSGGTGTFAWDTVTIPAAQIQSDWTQSNTSAVDYIKNKPQNLLLQAGTNISIVENSGIITISSTASGTITDVTVDGVSVVNAQGVAAITMPTVPTKTSDLTNDSGFITASQIPAQVQADWNESDSSDPSYIQNKPTIPAAQVNSDWSASTGVAQILNKPDLSVYALSANLATVATSGSYSDLSNKPNIPVIGTVTL